MLIHDVEGTKMSGVGYVATMKKLLPRTNPYSSLTVSSGELVVRYNERDQPFTHRLLCDRNIYMVCDETQVSNLTVKQMQLWEAIKKPADRIDVFNTRLCWGVGLVPGSNVFVAVPGKHVEVKAVVHYCGEVGQQSGHFFGVEISVSYLI